MHVVNKKSQKMIFCLKCWKNIRYRNIKLHVIIIIDMNCEKMSAKIVKIFNEIGMNFHVFFIDYVKVPGAFREWYQLAFVLPVKGVSDKSAKQNN